MDLEYEQTEYGKFSTPYQIQSHIKANMAVYKAAFDTVTGLGLIKDHEFSLWAESSVLDGIGADLTTAGEIVRLSLVKAGLLP